MKDTRFLFFIFAGLAVFILDTLTALGYAEWLLYIVLLFFYITYSEDKKRIPVIAGLYALLMFAGFFITSSIYFTIAIPIFNRVMGVIILALFTVVGMREKEAKKISSEILERVKDLFIALDRKLRVTFYNRRVMEFTDVKEDQVGKDVYEVFPVLRDDFLQSRLHAALSSSEPIHFEYAVPNSENFLEVSLYSSQKGISIFAKDVTKRVLAERKLMNLLHEKEMLMREMHHRTKNNFQLVLSLLNLQINQIKDEVAARILQETRARLLSISVLYDKLFRSGDIYSVDLHTFISDIILNMETAVNFGMLRMNNELRIEDARVSIEAAVPIGLIINELYTNSLKYAFNGNKTGSVSIEMKFPEQGTLYIRYKDNGKGLPDGFDLKNGGLGISLIKGFVSQLDGEISSRNNSGAEFEIKLKVIKTQKTLEIRKK